jgi:hypothetical protein
MMDYEELLVKAVELKGESIKRLLHVTAFAIA